MQLYPLQKLSHFEKTIVAIGNFDGLHLGHQKILTYLLSTAQKMGYPTCVLSFSPHPKLFFHPHADPFLITCEKTREDLLKKSGIDFLALQSFTKDFSQLTPQQFVQQVLVDTLKSCHVVVGENFIFGHQRKGNGPLLKMLGNHHGFSVDLLPIAAMTMPDLSKQIFSSSAIRDYIKLGEMEKVEKLLGRPWSLSGIYQNSCLKINPYILLPKIGTYEGYIRTPKNDPIPAPAVFEFNDQLIIYGQGIIPQGPVQILLKQRIKEEKEFDRSNLHTVQISPEQIVPECNNVFLTHPAQHKAI